MALLIQKAKANKNKPVVGETAAETVTMMTTIIDQIEVPARSLYQIMSFMSLMNGGNPPHSNKNQQKWEDYSHIISNLLPLHHLSF